MLQFWCEYGYDNKENKQELINIEAMSIVVSDRSGDRGVARVSFVRIWVKYKIEWNPDGDMEVTIPSILNRVIVAK